MTLEIKDLPKESFCSYGDTGSSKTHFWASSPRPFFIASKVERGYDTIDGMNPTFWFEVDRPPVYRTFVDNAEFMKVFKNDFLPLYNKGDALTLVIDSTSFLFESQIIKVLQEETAKANEKGKGVDMRTVWMAIQNYGRTYLNLVNSLSCNVVHIALDNFDEEEKQGALMISGKARKMIMAASSNIFYHKRSGGRFDIHLKEQGAWYARVRRMATPGAVLKSPLDEPTYRGMMRARGWDL